MAPGHHNLDCVSISLSYRLNSAKMHIISKWKERESNRVCEKERECVSVRERERERESENEGERHGARVGGVSRVQAHVQVVPLIRKFECGYRQGALFANSKATVTANMTGTTGAAWNDPTRGGELSKAQFAQGVDVIFAAAGGTGMGAGWAASLKPNPWTIRALNLLAHTVFGAGLFLTAWVISPF